jgi:arabinofuranosyltransferase
MIPPPPVKLAPFARAARAACLAALVAVYVVHALSYWHYVNDDAYITFRYGANLAQGRGPYFNDAEHVEGYTNLLLMLLTSAAIAVGGPPAAAPVAKGIGIAGGIVCVLVAFALARRLWPAGRAGGADACGLVAAGLVAVSPAFAVNSTSGLETTLFAACLGTGVLLGLRAQLEGGWTGSGVAFALAGLARPEGTAIFAVFWLARVAGLARPAGRADAWRGLWASSRRVGLVADAIVVTAVFAAHLAFRWLAYDGELLPNTVYAKIGGFAGISPWTYVQAGAVAPFLGWAGLALGLAGLALGRASLEAAAPLLAVSLFGAGEPLWAATDWMPGWRLVVPYLPLLAAWVGAGWCLLLSSARPLARIAPLLVLSTLPLHWTMQERERRALFDETLLRAQGYQTGHRALGLWLASGAARPGETVALMDIGIVGYSALGLRVLDLTGLTDRLIAKSPGGFLRKAYDPQYVFDRRPRYIVVVLAAPGRSYQQPLSGLVFQPWTPIERSILEHPEFQRWYARPRSARGNSPRWPQDYADMVGAERVFEHAHPGLHYLLALFRRQDAPSS